MSLFLFSEPWWFYLTGEGSGNYLRDSPVCCTKFTCGYSLLLVQHWRFSVGGDFFKVNNLVWSVKKNIVVNEIELITGIGEGLTINQHTCRKMLCTGCLSYCMFYACMCMFLLVLDIWKSQRFLIYYLKKPCSQISERNISPLSFCSNNPFK